VAGEARSKSAFNDGARTAKLRKSAGMERQGSRGILAERGGPCDPDHAADTAGGTLAEGFGKGRDRGLNLRRRREQAIGRSPQKFPAPSQIPFLGATGEQAVMPDARHSQRQGSAAGIGG